MNRFNKPQRIRALAFTLVELLVVLAIIGAVVGLLLPAVQAAREAARRMSCSNNLKQILLALHNYHDTYRKFPSGQYFCYRPCHTEDRSARLPGWGWAASILPFIEQGNLGNQLNFGLKMYDPVNLPIIRTPIPIFQCPSDATRLPDRYLGAQASDPRRIATSNYCGNGGSFQWSFETHLATNPAFSPPNPHWINGVLRRDSKHTIADITDGTSNTILIGEATHYNFRWDPAMYGMLEVADGVAGFTQSMVRNGNRQLNPPPTASNIVKSEGFHSYHTRGAQFGFCDGSVRFISETVEFTNIVLMPRTIDFFDSANGGLNYGVYQRLFSRNDGLPIGDF